MKTKIKNLQKAITENIYYLNCGGCIHFAYFFSKKLRELNIYHKVCFTSDSEIDLSYRGFASVMHVTIYIPGIGYIDGKSTKDKLIEMYNVETDHISLTKLNRLRREYEWNHDYDIDQNRKLNNLIKKYITNG